MFQSVLVWLGFAQPEGTPGSHGHDHHSGVGHGHTHGVVDPTIATTTRGIWVIKWSFIILAITSAFQLTVVLWSERAELDLAFDPQVSLQEAHKITTEFEAELFEHVPALASARILARPFDAAASG